MRCHHFQRFPKLPVLFWGSTIHGGHMRNCRFINNQLHMSQFSLDHPHMDSLARVLMKIWSGLGNLGYSQTPPFLLSCRFSPGSRILHSHDFFLTNASSEKFSLQLINKMEIIEQFKFPNGAYNYLGSRKWMSVEFKHSKCDLQVCGVKSLSISSALEMIIQGCVYFKGQDPLFTWKIVFWPDYYFF